MFCCLKSLCLFRAESLILQKNANVYLNFNPMTSFLLCNWLRLCNVSRNISSWQWNIFHTCHFLAYLENRSNSFKPQQSKAIRSERINSGIAEWLLAICRFAPDSQNLYIEPRSLAYATPLRTSSPMSAHKARSAIVIFWLQSFKQNTWCLIYHNM